MSNTIVGRCPRCGAPIYASTAWWGLGPPPSHPSCGCFPPPPPTISNSANTETLDAFPGCDGTQLPRTALPLNPDQAELVEKWCLHRGLDLLEPELAFLVCLLGDRAFSLAQAFYDAGFGAGAQNMLRRLS